MRLPITNRMPGGNETQKMLRQAVSLKAINLAESPSLATSATRKLKYMPTMAAAVSTSAKQPARRLRYHEAADHEQDARGQRNPEDAAPGRVFKGDQPGGVAQPGAA